MRMPNRRGRGDAALWDPRAEKILPWHRDRLAVVYVRQSRPQQVIDHQESTRLQYGLRERARDLGWATERVLVIDEDLGLSGATTAGRVGFARLVSEVSLDHVGLILGIEMSRLARSCADWYQLLERCALFGTLLADLDGVYDPVQYNDRLLLGLNSLESGCTACSTSASRPHRDSLQPEPTPRRKRRGFRIRRHPAVRRAQGAGGRGPSHAGGTDTRHANW